MEGRGRGKAELAGRKRGGLDGKERGGRGMKWVKEEEEVKSMGERLGLKKKKKKINEIH